jgi:hypothetical protein
VNSGVVGWKGFAAGIELCQRPNLSIRELNYGLQYSRRDAFTVTLATQRAMNDVVLSPVVNLGRSTSLFGMISYDTTLKNTNAWSTGMKYQLPVTASRTILKGKYDHDGRASISIDNSDLPFARLSFSTSFPLTDNSSSPAAMFGGSSSNGSSSCGVARPLIGFSMVFGDNHNEDDVNDDGSSSPALAPAAIPCPHCVV